MGETEKDGLNGVGDGKAESIKDYGEAGLSNTNSLLKIHRENQCWKRFLKYIQTYMKRD